MRVEKRVLNDALRGQDEAKPKSRNEVTAIAFMEASLTKGGWE